MNPKVSIILIDYNSHEDTIECIQSLQKIKYDNFDIYLIDNASPIQPSAAQKNFFYKNTNYIYNKKNTGFTGGNNLAATIAIKESNPQYLLLLNNDTTVEEDFLNHLVEVAEKDDQIGIVTGKILYYADKKRIWFAGGEYEEKTSRVSHLKCNVLNDDKVEEKRVTFITGCLMLIPVSVWKKTDGFDNRFFMYAEDLDLCCKVKKIGLKLVYTSKTIIYHKVGASIKANSPLQQYYNLRNNLYVIKTYSDNKKACYFWRAKLCADQIIRGRMHVKPVLKAVTDFRKNRFLYPEELKKYL